MEVHHPQLPHGQRRKFKEYFLEFFMLFLAVVPGFFAENIREHVSDVKKGKQYVKSLLADLKQDTTKLLRAANVETFFYIQNTSMNLEFISPIPEKARMFFAYFATSLPSASRLAILGRKVRGEARRALRRTFFRRFPQKTA
jgi:hypothetical protein